MTNWKQLLSDLSEVVMSSDYFHESDFSHYGIRELSAADRAEKWLGFPPASESEIDQAEERLGCRLPESLRQFYLTSNGWRLINEFIYEIVPIQKLDWIRGADPDFCSVIDGSFSGPGLGGVREENEFAVLRSLCLATKGDATTLLIDPENRVDDQEWVVGAWASWFPGIDWSGHSFSGFVKQALMDGRAMLEEQ